MHRTILVPRLFTWSSVLAGLVLFLGIHAASAQDLLPVNLLQEQPKKEDTPTVVLMTPGTTHTHTSLENLKKVENPNPKFLNVTAVAGNPKQVLFDALAPGRVRVKLTDVKDHVEYVDVAIVSDRVKELRDALQRVVPTGSVTVTTTNGDNSVILTGFVLTNNDARVVQLTAAQLFGANVINNVQIGGVQQVQLEVIITEVNRSEARNMNFSWMHQGTRGYVGNILAPGPYTIANALVSGVNLVGTANIPNGFNPVPGANIPFGVINDKDGFIGFLQALRSEGLAKIYAEPRLVTLSGRPGTMNVGGEVPIILPTGVGAPPSVTYKKFGTTVNFLPIVLGNGKIHLEVSPELSQIDNTITTGGGGVTAPAFRSRSVNVAVQIEDGQTLALAGLIQNTVTGTITRVPVLGDLPLIGMAFTSKAFQEVETEVIILVTPRLVDPVDCTKLPKYLPGRETRCPDDYELFMEGIMEAPRGPRNVIFHPSHYKAAHLGASNIGQIPCSDGNCYTRGNGCATGTCAPSFPMSNGVTTQRQMMSPATMATTREPEAMPFGGAPSLAPAVPTPVSSPSRQLDTRPVLPPVSFAPARP